MTIREWYIKKSCKVSKLTILPGLLAVLLQTKKLTRHIFMFFTKAVVAKSMRGEVHGLYILKTTLVGHPVYEGLSIVMMRTLCHTFVRWEAHNLIADAYSHQQRQHRQNKLRTSVQSTCKPE